MNHDCRVLYNVSTSCDLEFLYFSRTVLESTSEEVTFIQRRSLRLPTTPMMESATGYEELESVCLSRSCLFANLMRLLN